MNLPWTLPSEPHDSHALAYESEQYLILVLVSVLKVMSDLPLNDELESIVSCKSL